ncbi:MAG: hypothetical protein N3A61_01955, partial [Ignavibacteria bacterium]|nr:hypothetical protein [Ignavibacteria bacterium]
MGKKYIIVCILFLFTNLIYAQTPAVDISIVVSDNAGGTKTLKFGLDPTATDSIDAHLGEVEQPPPPPTGIFDARFAGNIVGLPLGQGLLNDYRQGSSTFIGTKIHQINYQVNTGATQITINYNLPSGVTGLIQDFLTGSIIN